MTSSPDEQMARYLAGEMSASERREFEDKILRDRELASTLYADVNLRSSFDEAARTQRGRAHDGAEQRDAWWRKPSFRWAVPAAAASVIVIVAIGIFNPRGPEDPSVFRGDGSVLQPITPKGDLNAPPNQFVWRSDPQATRYRFEWFDESSKPVFVTITADTVVSPGPADLSGPIPARGYWRVTPLDEMNVSGRPGPPVWYEYDY
jgi:hypothetical protein